MRLSKRWVAAQLLGSHIREELIELLVAEAFLIFGGAGPTSPMQGFLAFLRKTALEKAMDTLLKVFMKIPNPRFYSIIYFLLAQVQPSNILTAAASKMIDMTKAVKIKQTTATLLRKNLCRIFPSSSVVSFKTTNRTIVLTIRKKKQVIPHHVFVRAT